MPTLIKRYANRKLYNTKTSKYITLKGIAELLDAGEEVQVIDNESGEDITSVALSQILVDSERAKPRSGSGNGDNNNLLTQLLGKSGDALYEALRRGVDDASDNFEEMQDRFRRVVRGEVHRGQGKAGEDGEVDESGRRFSDWIAFSSPDVDKIVQNSVERVFKMLDLPRRSDIDALNENLKGVADAIAALEQSMGGKPGTGADANPPPSTSPGSTSRED